VAKSVEVGKRSSPQSAQRSSYRGILWIKQDEWNLLR
jgi:hypothetical protein